MSTVEVFDQISNRPSYWQPEGRWLCRLYHDAARQRVAMVTVCKKTLTAQEVRVFSLEEEGLTFEQFLVEWTPVVDGCQWKRRAPITPRHLSLMAKGAQCVVPVWDMPSPQFARALAARGLKLNGIGLLGDYVAGHREGYRCECEDTRCSSRGHWVEPAYCASDSPLVEWLLGE